MTAERPHPESALEQESALTWGFLEEEREPCAVVSSRMELVYLNEPARALVPIEWFAKRCFEVFPTADKLCAFHCPTLVAVQEGHGIEQCEESLVLADGTRVELDVAVIPIGDKAPDVATALLLLRRKGQGNSTQEALALAGEATELRKRIVAQLPSLKPPKLPPCS